MKQHFAECADKTLDRCRKILTERGAQYSDTWKECRFLALRSTLDVLKAHGMADRDLRAIAAAVFVDMKYTRLLGGYSDDSVVDGINYMALWADEMQGILGKY